MARIAHQVQELADQVGVPGPIDLRTEVAIPPDTAAPAAAIGKIVLHNDPAISPAKAWRWEHACPYPHNALPSALRPLPFGRLSETGAGHSGSPRTPALRSC